MLQDSNSHNQTISSAQKTNRNPKIHMVTQLPSGTVTFLFTDIEGSTRLWEDHPDSMHPALARHDALLEAAVIGHNGHIVKKRGDGLHAVFEAAVDAAQAAVAGQLSLLETRWEGIDALPVRMALHTGEAELRDGDYYGRAVNHVARLMDVTAGGQILASLTTAEIVRDRPPNNASILSIGDVQLKDLPRPMRLFEIHHPAFPEHTAGLRIDRFTPNNLPVEMSSFIGRADELAQVRQLLVGELAVDEPAADVPAAADPVAGRTTRLLSLTGPGGTGKTRLSLQAASDLLDRFPDGVWLIELAPLTEPAQVVPAAASPLSLQHQPGRPLEVRLVETIGERRILLILDNCEHLIEECARLADVLLRSCRNLHILASSREALGITGEWPLRLRSMAVPPFNQASTIEEMTRYDAILLFVDRAGAVKPGFALSAENANAIRQICERLDGIPLAIELAAARCRVLTPQQILARLDDRFQLLTGGSRTALPRQRTLQALIDWSYDLLTEPECIVLRRLSVFLDGCTLEAAEVVTGTDPVEPMNVLDILDQLVSKSLVVAGENEWGMRYRMLETIRQYAQAKLAESGEAGRMRDRHLAYFVAQSQLGHQAVTELRNLAQLDRLIPEAENLRLAQAWALEHDLPAAFRLTGGITARWSLILPAFEMLKFVENLLDRAENNPEFTGPGSNVEYRRLLGAGLTVASNLAFGIGFNKLAVKYATLGLEIARETGDIATASWALWIGGASAGLLGDLDKARAWVQESNTLTEKLADRWLEAVQLVGFSRHLDDIFAGNLRPGLEAWERGMSMFREAGDSWGLAWGYQRASGLYQILNNHKLAQDFAARSFALFEELNDRLFMTISRSILAELLRLDGEIEKSSDQYRILLLEWRDAGNQGALARCLECLAFMAKAQSDGAPSADRLPAQRHAALLLGAAAAIRDAHDTPMGFREKSEHEGEVAALKEALGEDLFQTAWRRGLTLSIEEALAIAQEGPKSIERTASTSNP